MTSQGSSIAPSHGPMPHSHICSPDMSSAFHLSLSSLCSFYPRCPILVPFPHGCIPPTCQRPAQMLYGYKLNYVLCSFRRCFSLRVGISCILRKWGVTESSRLWSLKHLGSNEQKSHWEIIRCTIHSVSFLALTYIAKRSSYLIGGKFKFFKGGRWVSVTAAFGYHLPVD